MRPSTRASRTLALGLLALALVGALAGPVAAGSDARRSSRSDRTTSRTRSSCSRTRRPSAAPTSQVHILVLPITYSLSADGTTKSERKKNLTLADTRRGQVEDACNVVRQPSQACLVQLVPVLVRTDAVAFDPAPYFTADLDGMFVLGGDQTVGMNTVHDTPLEAAMTAAFHAGAVLGGNSAGDAVQSRDMINGYYGDNGPAESLRQGAVQVCFDSGPTDCQGGLPFGFPNVITDQHVFEYGRTGRSLNVSLSTGKPVLGMDAATGAVVTDYVHLRDVTGDTLGYVVDPRAYLRDGLLRRPEPDAADPRRRDAPAAARLGLRVRHDDAEPGRRRPSPSRASPAAPTRRSRRRPRRVRCSSPAESSAIPRGSSATRSPRPPAAARHAWSCSPRATP